MEPISHDENSNPKSLGRIGYNTAFKNKIQFKNNFHTKKLARTPLKSKLNLMNSSQGQNSINSQNEKVLKYPLLKSISSSNINFHNKKNISYDLNNNEIYDYDEEDEYEYNKDALPDEITDFMHVKENEVNIVNDVEDMDNNEIKEITGYKKQGIKIMDDVINPFCENNNNNYVLAAHFESDDDEDNNRNGNGIGNNNKKKFDDYFNEPDEIDMI